MASPWPLQDQTCIVGIGESQYWKRGGANESAFRLVCRAVKAACEDAGLPETEIDGLVGYIREKTVVE